MLSETFTKNAIVTFAIYAVSNLSAPQTAQAELIKDGHATGNGGFIYKDQHNPWFLENTRIARYCIDIDTQRFGVSAAEASAQVKNALQDWKNVFSLSSDDYYNQGSLEPFGQIRIATQQFEEHSCSDPVEIDLRFQLGNLSEDQRKLIGDPTEYIGISVRTDYQRSTLKGRGFIYLAPLSGTLMPNHNQLHNNAWSEYNFFALKIILRHELGHVFGLDHTPNSVMDEAWPEMFVDRGFLNNLTPSEQRYFEKKTDLLRLFGLRKDWSVEDCGLRNPIFSAAFFGENHREKSCGKITFNNNKLTIQYKDSSDGTFTNVASAKITNYHVNSVPLISVFIPREQQVFTKIPEKARRINRLYGEPMNVSQKWQADLFLEGSADKIPLQIEANLHQSAGSVFWNGYFENDVFFLD